MNPKIPYNLKPEEPEVTLLDLFAMHILQGMIVSESHIDGMCVTRRPTEEYPSWYSRNASRAYDWAEAMLAERERRKVK